eukprot:COSAG02_NODE_20687_length_819_cov_1.259722_1_plen_253_part_01
MKRELWMIDESFALWRHLTERNLALELTFDDLQARIEHLHLASAFDKWMDFLLEPEYTTAHAIPAAPLHAPVKTRVPTDTDKQNAPIDGPWTPGSTIHKDWSWPQQLELLQSRRAEQDWLGAQSDAKSTATPKMIADLVADMRETRLTHQAKMNRLRAELVAGQAIPQTPGIGSSEEVLLPLEESAFGTHHSLGGGRENREEIAAHTFRPNSHAPNSTPVHLRSQGGSPSTPRVHSTAALLDDQAAAASRLFR